MLRRDPGGRVGRVRSGVAPVHRQQVVSMGALHRPGDRRTRLDDHGEGPPRLHLHGHAAAGDEGRHALLPWEVSAN